MTADKELVDGISETVMDEEGFVGFSREELGIHSSVEVEEYDVNDDDEEDETGGKIHNEVAAQVVDQEWTRTLTAMNIPPFSVKNPGPTNILNENQTELNFFEPLHKILVRETNFNIIHVCLAESHDEARSKQKQNNFLTSTLLVSHIQKTK